jgi:tRNA A-37 threonylcarbamoyl transferase component Bud32
MTWIITPPFADSPAAHAFATLEQAYARGGEIVSTSARGCCRRVEVGERRYYVKIYAGAGKGLRSWLGRSRVRTEWENLVLFQSLGIPTPPVVAYGETRKRGCFHGGVLITAEVPDAVDLRTLAIRRDAHLLDAVWRREVLRRVADYTRCLHQAGFVHNDLNWRNILVTTEGAPEVFFIDCPSGRWWPRLLREGRTIKDLAYLDKLGRQYLSRADRLRFYRSYREIGRLQPEDKRHVGRVLGYLRQRFADKYDRRPPR